MYHSEQPFTVELPDSIEKIQHLSLHEVNGVQVFHLVAELRGDKKISSDLRGLRLHLTNGVNHYYYEFEDYQNAPEEIQEKRNEKGKK